MQNHSIALLAAPGTDAESRVRSDSTQVKACKTTPMMNDLEG